MNSPRKITVSASLFLVFGLALTGCSGAAEPAGDAPAKSEQVAAPASGELTQENFVERISNAQLEAGSAHVSMSTAGTVTGEGDMQLSADPSKISMAMTMQLPTGQAETRIVEGVMFMNLGEISQNKFVDLSQSAMKDQFAGSVDQMNPETQLKSFAAAIESFEAEPGTEQIDGVDVTKVSLTLNTEKLLSANPLTQAQAGELAAVVGPTLEYVMYVGADDLPRRISVPAVGPSAALDMNYSAWGKPVTVEAPAADQLIDAAAIGM